MTDSWRGGGGGERGRKRDGRSGRKWEIFRGWVGTQGINFLPALGRYEDRGGAVVKAQTLVGRKCVVAGDVKNG